jgi:hypothetical protein
LFAHFLRKTICAAPKSAAPPNYFRAPRATSTGVFLPRVSATLSARDARARQTPANKSAEKKRFPNSRDNAAANALARRPADHASDRPPASGGIAAGHENNSPKVLTLEKTVIRFRAADMTCRRE